MVFRRSSSNPSDGPPAPGTAPASGAPGAQQDASAAVPGQGPKGRPTPSRKEAEAARKQSLRVPADPKAARKAMRERERAERSASRAALLAGDEKHLPARDQGPAKAFTRDFVDSRFTAAEYFVFVALGVLILGFVRNAAVQFWVSVLWFAMTAFIIFDTGYLVWRLQRALRAQFPDKADRRGTTFYAVLRTLQLRRLRLPPPRLRRGGRPVEPRRRR